MTAYRQAADQVRAVWTANWAPVSGVPVLWDLNTLERTPTDAATAHWLHLSIEFAVEELRAYGGGRLANERLLMGSLVIRAFARRGYGEATLLDLLSAGMAAVRGRRVGDLSFIGDAVIPEPGASEDGAWWMRSAIAAFEFRFVG